uniref:Uncharacterized protein n=1 Tax=Poecilia latipinna TaxID=48699 RepID=A0A3B3VJS6_9TELE
IIKTKEKNRQKFLVIRCPSDACKYKHNGNVQPLSHINLFLVQINPRPSVVIRIKTSHSLKGHMEMRKPIFHKHHYKVQLQFENVRRDKEMLERKTGGVYSLPSFPTQLGRIGVATIFCVGVFQMDNDPK